MDERSGGRKDSTHNHCGERTPCCKGMLPHGGPQEAGGRTRMDVKCNAEGDVYKST